MRDELHEVGSRVHVSVFRMTRLLKIGMENDNKRGLLYYVYNIIIQFYVHALMGGGYLYQISCADSPVCLANNL